MQRSVCALSVALGFAVLSGCTPAAAPPVSSAPVPSVPVCEPVDGATPYPCTQADFDALAQQRALYEEAQGAVRRYEAEVARQGADWQLREVTPELEATTTGDFRNAVEEFIRQDRADQAVRVGEPAEIAWFEPALDKSRNASEVAVRACIDATTERYVTRSNSSPTPGVAVVHTYYLVREAGQLKIATSDYEDVAAC